MLHTYDFIVAGSGPAGAVIASRLARSAAMPTVLLLEAGEANNNASIEQQMVSNRLATSAMYPNLNWGYNTVPQEHLGGRSVDYSRGKGLGGSSLINYAFWTVGSKDDYDEWASLVEDESFDWQNMQRRLRNLERYRIDPGRKPFEQYASPRTEDHGTAGDLDIELPQNLEPEVLAFMASMQSAGASVNLDLNSGDPLGIGIVPMTSRSAMRVTAGSAFLGNPPPNLTIKTDSPVSRILFEKQTAVGVETSGNYFRASKEVIICCGALDSPKLLMLSGIGDEQELNEHNIQLIASVPGVGKNLQDHPCTIWLSERKSPPSQSYDAWHIPSATAIAQEQLREDGTGPFAMNGLGMIVGFLSDEEMLSSEAFKSLPQHVKDHVQKPTVPTYETTWALMNPPPGMDPRKSYLLSASFVQSVQSKGTVRLASADPKDAPVCDPAVFSHPFDRENAIRALRNTLTVPGNPATLGDIKDPMNSPAALDDESLWAYLQQNAGLVWHMCCTVKMGKKDDPEACVDAEFRVRGTQRLRCADMSVTPFLPNCHTASVAYLIGETAAEKLICEYGLADSTVA